MGRKRHYRTLAIAIGVVAVSLATLHTWIGIVKGAPLPSRLLVDGARSGDESAVRWALWWGAGSDGDGELAMHMAERRGDHHIAEMILETRLATGAFATHEILIEVRAGHSSVVVRALEKLPPEAAARLALRGLEAALAASRPDTVRPLAEGLVREGDGRIEETFVSWIERDVDLTFLNALLDAGVFAGRVSSSGTTTLMTSVPRERDDVVEELLRRGAPEAAARLALRGLEAALAASRPDAVRPLAEVLVREGDGRIEETFVSWIERDVNLTFLNALLDAGVFPGGVSSSGTTALMTSVLRERDDVVEELLQRGADPNRADLATDRPVLAAIRSGNRRIEEMLRRAGGTVGAEEERRHRLVAAVRSGRLEDLRTFSSEGASVNEIYPMLDGASLLHVATRTGRRDVVSFLLSRGADPSFVDGQGNNVLDVAAATGTRCILALVLDQCWDLDALHHAMRAAKGLLETFLRADDYVTSEKREAAVRLLDDVRRRALANRHAFLLAALHGETRKMETLASGCTPHDYLLAEWTPLMAAVLARNRRAVRWLLSRAADPERANTFDVTPIALASAVGLDVRWPSGVSVPTDEEHEQARHFVREQGHDVLARKPRYLLGGVLALGGTDGLFVPGGFSPDAFFVYQAGRGRRGVLESLLEAGSYSFRTKAEALRAARAAGASDAARILAREEFRDNDNYSERSQ